MGLEAICFDYAAIYFESITFMISFKKIYNNKTCYFHLVPTYGSRKEREDERNMNDFL